MFYERKENTSSKIIYNTNLITYFTQLHLNAIMENERIDLLIYYY